MQTIGETTDAIMADGNKMLSEILAENKGKSSPYWIVIAAKGATVKDKEGRRCIMQHFKAHHTKPKPLVGSCIGEVDPHKGTIKWEINLHDSPFGYEALGLKQDGVSVCETSIPQAYLYE